MLSHTLAPAIHRQNSDICHRTCDNSAHTAETTTLGPSASNRSGHSSIFPAPKLTTWGSPYGLGLGPSPKPSLCVDPHRKCAHSSLFALSRAFSRLEVSTMAGIGHRPLGTAPDLMAPPRQYRTENGPGND